MGNFLLLHGTMVTVDRERRIIEDCGLAIQGDRIVDIGTAAELAPRHSDKQIIDCRENSSSPASLTPMAMQGTR